MSRDLFQNDFGVICFYFLFSAAVVGLEYLAGAGQKGIQQVKNLLLQSHVLPL